jgi:hypothetical protein
MHSSHYMLAKNRLMAGALVRLKTMKKDGLVSPGPADRARA